MWRAAAGGGGVDREEGVYGECIISSLRPTSVHARRGGGELGACACARTGAAQTPTIGKPLIVLPCNTASIRDAEASASLGRAPQHSDERAYIDPESPCPCADLSEKITPIPGVASQRQQVEAAQLQGPTYTEAFGLIGLAEEEEHGAEVTGRMGQGAGGGGGDGEGRGGGEGGSGLCGAAFHTWSPLAYSYLLGFRPMLMSMEQELSQLLGAHR